MSINVLDDRTSFCVRAGQQVAVSFSLPCFHISTVHRYSRWIRLEKPMRVYTTQDDQFVSKLFCVLVTGVRIYLVRDL